MGKKTARGRGHQGGRKPPKGARRFKGGRVAPRAEQLHFPDDVQAVFPAVAEHRLEQGESGKARERVRQLLTTVSVLE